MTGYPFIDACMRSLNHNGWITFRMRAMLVSFASYDLWLDWRKTGQHLAQTFTDYEPGIHYSQLQMQSGVTGINTFRIYNPVKQSIEHDNNGAFKKGSLKAELDIKKDLWFFDCHFKEDPVMPGCLGLDAMWQLVGFYLGWIGNPGKGRALGVGTVKFTGEVLQNVKLVTYEIDMKKIMSPGGTTVGLANGVVLADGKKIYSAESLKVGLFK